MLACHASITEGLFVGSYVSTTTLPLEDTSNASMYSFSDTSVLSSVVWCCFACNRRNACVFEGEAQCLLICHLLVGLLHKTYWSVRLHTILSSSTPYSGASLARTTQLPRGEPLAWISTLFPCIVMWSPQAPFLRHFKYFCRLSSIYNFGSATLFMYSSSAADWSVSAI